jgi:hypothetical protein
MISVRLVTLFPVWSEAGCSAKSLRSIMAAAQSGNLSIGGVISQAIAGGAGGAILTALIGAIKNKAAA